MMGPVEALRWATPSVLTIAALLCGLTAVRNSAEGDFGTCVQMIFLACVLDGLDGHTARALGTSSVFGFELDSLCDLANFGVSPALAIHFWLKALPAEGHSLGPSLEWAACCAHAACCALRLARFNVAGHAAQMDKQIGKGGAEEVGDRIRSNLFKRKMYFEGVPAPIGAAYALAPITLSQSRLPALFGSIGEAGAWSVGRRGTTVMLFVTALLMVCSLPTLSSKMLKSSSKDSHLQSRHPLYSVVKAAAGCGVLYAVWAAPHESFLGLVVIHGCSIPLGFVLYYFAGTNGSKKTV